MRKKITNFFGGFWCLLTVFDFHVNKFFQKWGVIFDFNDYNSIDGGLPYDPSFADLIINFINIYKCLVILF